MLSAMRATFDGFTASLTHTTTDMTTPHVNESTFAHRDLLCSFPSSQNLAERRTTRRFTTQNLRLLSLNPDYH